MADSAWDDMLLVYAGKVRAETEGDGSRLRAERESRSVLVATEALVEIPLEFEGRKGWARAATRLRRTRESMVSDQVGGGNIREILVCQLFHPSLSESQ